MLPLSEQYLHSPVEIKSIANDLICTGILTDITQEGVQISNAPEKMPIIHCNTAVKINVFNNALGFRVLVGVVYLSTSEFLRIVEVQSASDFEKRDFFRVRVRVKTDAYLVRDDVEPNVPVEMFPVDICDISLSGLYFKTDEPLREEDRLVINLNVCSSKMSLLCKVKRKVNPPEENAGYGCEFIDNSGRQFDLLCRYIFDCQREQIQAARTHGLD